MWPYRFLLNVSHVSHVASLRDLISWHRCIVIVSVLVSEGVIVIWNAFMGRRQTLRTLEMPTQCWTTSPASYINTNSRFYRFVNSTNIYFHDRYVNNAISMHIFRSPNTDVVIFRQTSVYYVSGNVQHANSVKLHKKNSITNPVPTYLWWILPVGIFLVMSFNWTTPNLMDIDIAFRMHKPVQTGRPKTAVIKCSCEPLGRMSFLCVHLSVISSIRSGREREMLRELHVQ